MSEGLVCFCGHYAGHHAHDDGACAFEFKGEYCICKAFDKVPDWDGEAKQMLAEGRPIQKCTIHKLWFLTLCRRCHPEEYLRKVSEPSTAAA